MASKVLRIILIVVLFIIFFEVGLVSSYTIVTSEAPNVQGLIDMQISKIAGMFTPEKVNDFKNKIQDRVNKARKKYHQAIDEDVVQLIESEYSTLIDHKKNDAQE